MSDLVASTNNKLTHEIKKSFVLVSQTWVRCTRSYQIVMRPRPSILHVTISDDSGETVQMCRLA